jgi:hypothetical protein
MTEHAKKDPGRAAKIADATRVVHEFRAQYPRDRKRPASIMLPRLSTWELLGKCETQRAQAAARPVSRRPGGES